MTCVICKNAETETGTTTVTLERDGLTLVLKAVPAAVCPNCGEAYVNEEVAGRLLETAEELWRSGAQIDVREFAAAGR
jgi:YgiT-type zinc finger domain-containing protein